jgi:hypothetical protein
MSATFEHHDGCTTCISDAGRAKLAAEQRDPNQDQQRAEIFMWSTAGSIVTIAALVITHLLGKS